MPTRAESGPATIGGRDWGAIWETASHHYGLHISMRVVAEGTLWFTRAESGVEAAGTRPRALISVSVML
jgi:hypothetical protein